MSRKLVAYFSATGTTTKVAELLADAVGADILKFSQKFLILQLILIGTTKIREAVLK